MCLFSFPCLHILLTEIVTLLHTHNYLFLPCLCNVTNSILYNFSLCLFSFPCLHILSTEIITLSHTCNHLSSFLPYLNSIINSIIYCTFFPCFCLFSLPCFYILLTFNFLFLIILFWSSKLLLVSP